jgi:hypothetical protein
MAEELDVAIEESEDDEKPGGGSKSPGELLWKIISINISERKFIHSKCPYFLALDGIMTPLDRLFSLRRC